MTIHEVKNNPINNGISALMKAAANRNTQEMAVSIVNIIKSLGDFTNGGLQRLWEIMMQNGQEVYKISTLTEINRLTSDLVLNLLIEKNVISREELEARVTKEVKEEFERIQKEAQKEAEKIREELEKDIEEKQKKLEEEQEKIDNLKEENTEEEKRESNVILPSERNNIITFPTKKRE